MMWSWNPAEMRDGTNSEYFIKKARERGARVVCLDPRQTLSAVALADEWIPVRPGTDAALMSAMAYVMITENLHDRDFIRTHCVGFDETQMPAGRGRRGELQRLYPRLRATGRPRRRSGPSRSRPCRGRPSPGWPASTPRPSRPSSTRATACSGGLTASRPCGPAASWPPSPATSASRAAGPGASPCRPPMAARTRTSCRWARTRSRRKIPIFLWTRGRPARRLDGTGRRRRRRGEAGDGPQAHLVGGLQHPHQPAQQRQPLRGDPGRREQGRVPGRPGQLPDPHGPLRRPAPAGLHAVRDLGRPGRLEVRRGDHPGPQDRRSARRSQERLRHLRRRRREAGCRRGLHRGPRRARLDGVGRR